ncbi:MAG: hypothetical protein HYS60_00380, partial [Candidatus Wildermuthbacteria bacterium]|nr:hypothetical protein [Candidatus Wildermuthbacteria bacterium]
ALLFAVNIVLVVFYFRRRAKLQQAAGLSFAGALSGLLGIGCAACGSVILSSVFGIGATASFLSVLPLKGQELGILSVIILSASIYLVYRKINDPLICKPSQKI